VTHAEGKFPAKQTGDDFFPFAASLPFPKGKKITQEVQRELCFHLDPFTLWIL